MEVAGESKNKLKF